MTSKIEQLIDEIETYIDNCKPQPLSQTKIIVNKEEIDELLRELRSKTPEEIKRYQQIISNKEAIYKDAKQKAQDLIDKATIQQNELTSEHEIMQQAEAQANERLNQAANMAQEMLEKATIEANEIKANATIEANEIIANANAINASAYQYLDQKLAIVEEMISNSIDATIRHDEEMIASIKQNSDSLLSKLTQYSEIIKSNRAELQPYFNSTAAANGDQDGLNLDIIN